MFKCLVRPNLSKCRMPRTSATTTARCLQTKALSTLPISSMAVCGLLLHRTWVSPLVRWLGWGSWGSGTTLAAELTLNKICRFYKTPCPSNICRELSPMYSVLIYRTQSPIVVSTFTDDSLRSCSVHLQTTVVGPLPPTVMTNDGLSTVLTVMYIGPRGPPRPWSVDLKYNGQPSVEKQRSVRQIVTTLRTPWENYLLLATGFPEKKMSQKDKVAHQAFEQFHLC